jgi:FkbM family methyltransferase
MRDQRSVLQREYWLLRHGQQFVRACRREEVPSVTTPAAHVPALDGVSAVPVPMPSTSVTNLFARASLARLLADHPLAALDVGARGGFEADLLPIAFGVDAYAFEPEPQEARRLSDTRGPWRSLTVAPYGLSGAGGPQPLHLAKAPQSASLMEHDEAIGWRFNRLHMFVEERRVPVMTRTLDEAVRDLGARVPAYLKIDIEGPELDVLRGGPDTLQAVVAVQDGSVLPAASPRPTARPRYGGFPVGRRIRVDRSGEPDALAPS